jgi:hypothetical protein
MFHVEHFGLNSMLVLITFGVIHRLGGVVLISFEIFPYFYEFDELVYILTGEEEKAIPHPAHP